MTRRLLTSAMMLLTMSLAFVACSEDEPVVTTPVQVTLNMPLGAEDATLHNAVATLTNIQSGVKYTVTAFHSVASQADNTLQYAGTTTIPVGNYNVDVEGQITYTIDGTATTAHVKATSQAYVAPDNNNVAITLNTYNAQDGFVIEELYYTSSPNEKGTNYSYDQYVKITNNSDQILYADSLAFIESSFLTSTKHDYTPDIMDQAFSADAIYMIPGTGKDHPVKPGESLILAINAENHSLKSADYIDLSAADFEFYDESSVTSSQDIDNPNVPNLDKWYAATSSVFILHTQGYKTYVLAKMNTDKAAFLENNRYDVTYLFVFGDLSKEMVVADNYKIPNSWIVDAVNLGDNDKWEWNLTAPSLDAGYTFVSTAEDFKSRFGKAICRKRMVNGKLQDTNNSTNDFEIIIPSLKK